MNDIMKKIQMSSRGLFHSTIRLNRWKQLLKGKYVKISVRGLQYKKLLVLNDFVELKGTTNNIRFGSNSFIGKYTVIKANFDTHSFLEIGDNFGCAEFCFFGCAGGIKIGNNVMIGQNVRFHAQNHVISSIEIPMSEQGTTQKGIVIEDDCWFGSGSVVVDGVKIGKGCVIGANAVVTKDIPDYSVVAGVPAKIIRNRKKA